MPNARPAPFRKVSSITLERPSFWLFAISASRGQSVAIARAARAS
jgi:hypothetical protein